ncbi:N-6 DNA methylase [Streptomyces rochei]|uniref:N-6 DNA methylase n=1 Tax=Streptomyces rochei TaxID=1928 RepID=UPI0036CB9773
MSLSKTVKSLQDIMRKDAGVDGDAQRIGQLGWMLFFKIYSDLEVQAELEHDDYTSPIPAHLRWEAWADENILGKDAPTGERLLDLVDNHLFPALKELDLDSLDGRTRERGALLKSAFGDAYNYMKSGTLMRQVINKINQDIDFNQSKTRHLFGDIYEQILRDLQSAGNAGEFYTPRAATQFAVDMVDPRPHEVVLDPACGTGGFLTSAYERMRSQVTTASELAMLRESIRGVEKKALPHLLCVTNMMIHGIEVPSNIRHGNTLARPLRDYGADDEVDIIVTNPPFGGMEEDGIENNFPAEFRTRETADLFLVLVMELLKKGGRAAIVLPDSTLFGDGIKRRIKKRLLEECNLHTIVRLPAGAFAPYTNITTNILFLTKGEPTKEIWYYQHPLPSELKTYSKTKPMRVEEFDLEKAWWDDRREDANAWKVPVSDIVSSGYNLDVKNPRSDDAVCEGSDVALQVYQQSRSDFQEAKASFKELLSSSLHERGAVPDVLLEHFDSIVQAPHGLSRLRSLIYELAVRGDLVPQDISEGTGADVLLRLAEEGKVPSKSSRRSKLSAVSGLGGVEELFPVPETWEWATFAQVAEIASNLVDPGLYLDEPHVAPDSIEKMTGRLLQYRTVREDRVTSSKHKFHAGQILYSKIRPNLSKAVTVDFGGLCSADMYPINAWIDPAYLLTYILSPPFIQAVTRDDNRVAMPKVNQAQLSAVPVPVPPLSEQHRIVERVTELTRLCDRTHEALRRKDSSAEKLALAATRLGA